MAIKLAYELPSGVVGEYWRVLTVQADADDKTVCGMVALYVDKDARDSGKKPVHTILYNTTTQSITNNLVSCVYDHLKQSTLQGGEDA